MLAKQITFEDVFSGEKITKTFYFNLTKAELMELEKSKKGGLSEIIKRIIEEKENEKLIPLFKEIISMSYGERTDYGTFVKNEINTNAFLASEAYSELFMSFFEADNLINFIKGIMPKSLMEEVEKQIPGGLNSNEEVMKYLQNKDNILKMKESDSNVTKDNSST